MIIARFLHFCDDCDLIPDVQVLPLSSSFSFFLSFLYILLHVFRKLLDWIATFILFFAIQLNTYLQTKTVLFEGKGRRSSFELN